MKKSKAALIQQVYHGSEYVKLMALTYERNLNYCTAHEMDFCAIYGNVVDDWPPAYGGWAKVVLLMNALQDGYEHVIWLDVDAVIADTSVDLRDGCPSFGLGMTLHKPEQPVFNAGVIYVTNSPATQELMREWLAWYPGPIHGWHEQAMINLLSYVPHYQRVVVAVDAKWNSTRAGGNHVDNAVVEGFHGEGAAQRRLELMKEFLEQHANPV